MACAHDAHNNSTATTAAQNTTLTTGVANCVILALVYINSNSGSTRSVSTMADTRSLTWNFLTSKSATNSTQNTKWEIWWAFEPTAQSHTVTTTLTGAPDGCNVCLVSVSGMFNSAAPYDSNAGNPWSANGTTPVITFTTSQANDLLILGGGTNAGTTGEGSDPAGWNSLGGALGGAGSWCATHLDYKNVSTIQTAQTANLASQSGYSISILVALTSDNNAVSTIVGKASVAVTVNCG